MHRLPSLYHSLGVAKQIAPECFATIFDIGAQKQTDFLADTFPEARHILFEPCDVYHDELSSYYSDKDIEHEIVGTPLCEKNKTMYMHKISHDGSGDITHTCLYNMRIENLNNLVQIDEVEATTLDSYYFDRCSTAYDHTYMVKLDVDGNDDDIITGGMDCISRASFIVTEMSLSETDKFVNRISTICSLGVRIFDICDVGYYYGQASQIDMVFINEQVRGENKLFQPWGLNENLVWNQWQHHLPGHRDTYTVDFGDHDK